MSMKMKIEIENVILNNRLRLKKPISYKYNENHPNIYRFKIKGHPMDFDENFSNTIDDINILYNGKYTINEAGILDDASGFMLIQKSMETIK